MPEAVTIRSIRALKDIGIFGDFTPSADLPPFRKANLIYGFNGTGKTTLSRIFSSLETGILHEELDPTASFQIELTDGSVIKSGDGFDQLKGRLLVLNVDFVKRTLRWDEAAADPIYYIGTEQVSDISSRIFGIIFKIMA